MQKIITNQGGSITKTEMNGRRQLAYEINHKREGVYVLLEVEGTGGEIAELERRMRVNDQILRYMTIRVDEDRRRAEKLKGRRARKAARRGSARKRKQLRQNQKMKWKMSMRLAMVALKGRINVNKLRRARKRVWIRARI